MDQEMDSAAERQNPRPSSDSEPGPVNAAVNPVKPSTSLYSQSPSVMMKKKGTRHWCTRGAHRIALRRSIWVPNFTLDVTRN